MRYLFVLMSIVPLALAAPVPKDPKVVDMFPVKEGSTWVYSVQDTQKKDQTEESVKITKVTKKGDEITATEEGRGAAGQKPAEVRITPKEITLVPSEVGAKMEWILWKTGAKKGDTWDNKVDFGAAIGGAAGGGAVPQITYTMTSAVGDIEEVKVPAGTFKAQLVTTTISISLPGMAPIKIAMKIWLADGVGIVRSETNGDGAGLGQMSRITELKKYTVGK